MEDESGRNGGTETQKEMPFQFTFIVNALGR